MKIGTSKSYYKMPGIRRTLFDHRGGRSLILQRQENMAGFLMRRISDPTEQSYSVLLSAIRFHSVFGPQPAAVFPGLAISLEEAVLVFHVRRVG